MSNKENTGNKQSWEEVKEGYFRLGFQQNLS